MICLFEDRKASQFYPVALTRHLSELLVGTMTLRTRATRLLGDDEVILHGRAGIREYHRSFGQEVLLPEGEHDPILFLNARLLLTPEIVATFPAGDNWVLTAPGGVVAARLDAAVARQLDWKIDALEISSLSGVEFVQTDVDMPEFLWDLLSINGALIESDFDEREGIATEDRTPGVYLVSSERISIGEGSRLKPGVVIDASDGAVVIGSGVEIMANAVIQGPCSIGDNSTIKIAAKIYGHTSIGPWCKVGGEVENSIILGYSNKQHDGFLGHSYLGRWVNLGADTNTSDLKNNYGSIRVVLADAEIDTGRMFLGSLIGDHSKTGINTMLNTGTVIGVAANIFGGGFPPKAIPSFSWGGADGLERFDLEKGIDLARRVMARRRIEFTEADERLLREIEQGGR